MLDFAARMKFIRTTLLGQTREQFAKFVDMPEVTLRSWEIRKCRPGDASLMKFFNNLQDNGVKFSKEWLLTGSGPSPFDNQLKSEHISADTIEIKLSEGYEPFFTIGSSITCSTILEDHIQHKDLIVALENDQYFLARAIKSSEDELFLAPIVKNDIGPIIRFSKKRMELFKIIGFKSI